MPGLPADLEQVRVTLAGRRDQQKMAASSVVTLAVLVVMWGLGVIFKRYTRRWRVACIACIADDTRSRGAIRLVVLDFLGHFAVVSVSAYLTIR